METAILIGFYLLILLYSIIIHEIMHGIVALWLGDMTAKYAGRLTLSPKSHIDPLGSIVVPLGMLVVTSFSFAFGWAKPVPYNPYNLRNQRWGPALVALAGPGVNVLIALVAAIIGKLIPLSAPTKLLLIQNLTQTRWEEVAGIVSGSPNAIIFLLLAIIIFWNVLLAIFNMIPIPPLDGSKLLFSVLPISHEKIALLEQFGFIILIAAILLFQAQLSALLNFFWGIFFGIAI